MFNYDEKFAELIVLIVSYMHKNNVFEIAITSLLKYFLSKEAFVEIYRDNVFLRKTTDKEKLIVWITRTYIILTIYMR